MRIFVKLLKYFPLITWKAGIFGSKYKHFGDVKTSNYRFFFLEALALLLNSRQRLTQ